MSRQSSEEHQSLEHTSILTQLLRALGDCRIAAWSNLQSSVHLQVYSMVCNGQVRFIPSSLICDQQSLLVAHFQRAFAQLSPPELRVSFLRYLSLSFPEIPAINPTSLVTSTEAPAGKCSVSLTKSMAPALPWGHIPPSLSLEQHRGGAELYQTIGQKINGQKFW